MARNMPKSETSDVSNNSSPLSTGSTTMPDDKKTASSNVKEDSAQAQKPVLPIVYKLNMSELGLFVQGRDDLRHSRIC